MADPALDNPQNAARAGPAAAAPLPALARSVSVGGPAPAPPCFPPLVRARSAAGPGEAAAGGSLRPSNFVASTLHDLCLPIKLAVPADQLRELECAVCRKLIDNPVYAPCGHSFCHSHLNEGPQDGEGELSACAALLRRLCVDLGFTLTRAREALVASQGDAARAERLCRQASGLEGRAVRIRPEVSQPQFKWGSVTRGSIGRVVRVEGGHVQVDFPEQSRWHGLVQELEVDDVADSVRKGARVAVRPGRQPTMGWGALEGDQTGEVIHVTGARVIVAAEGNLWYGHIGELEPTQACGDAADGTAGVPAAGTGIPAALRRMAAAGPPAAACLAGLGAVLTEACTASSTPLRIMLRGERRTAIMCHQGAADFLAAVGFRVASYDPFRTRALIQADAEDLAARAKGALEALEAAFGECPAGNDEDDLRFAVRVTVDKASVKGTDFDKYWEETLRPKLIPALAPQKHMTWSRRGWESEEALKAHLGRFLFEGSPTSVARGQPRRAAKQIASVLEGAGFKVSIMEEFRVGGEAAALGEDPTDIQLPAAWQGTPGKRARVRLCDLPEGHALASVGALTGVVAAQYLHSQDGLIFVVNFPRNPGRHVPEKYLQVDRASELIQAGTQVKVNPSPEPLFGWQGVDSNDLGVVHAVQFDGAVLVYFPSVEHLFVATFSELATDNLPTVGSGRCPMCLAPLLRGEHLSTDVVVDAQVRRVRRLMDGGRTAMNDAIGGAADKPPEAPQLIRTQTHQGELTCSICMDLMVQPVTLPCGHSFCKAHIEAWLLQHESCPNCKHRILPERLYKRRGAPRRAALFDFELRDAEPRGEAGGEGAEAAPPVEAREWPEIPVNQMLERQVVRHFPQQLEDRRAEIAEEVWDALQRRAADYLPRLRAFLRQFDAVAVRRIADQGLSEVDAPLPGTSGGTLLMLAAEQGTAGAVQELLQSRADPLAVANASAGCEGGGATALSLAAARGHSAVLATLLASAAWPVVRVADALAAAVEQQQHECLEVLLRHREDAAVLCNSYGFPALVTATQTNSTGAISTLLASRAQLEVPLESGLLVSGAGIAPINGVFQRAGEFEGKPYYQNSSGAVIYWKGWWKMGRALQPGRPTQGWYYSMPEPRGDVLEPPPGAWTAHGYDGIDALPPPTVQRLEKDTGATATPLLLAVQLGFVEIATQLLEAQADVRSRLPGGSGAELLQVAAVGGDLSMVRTLLRFRASLTAADADGKTPLHAACAAGHHLVAAELLGADAPPDSDATPTPLMLASCCGRYPPEPGQLWQLSVAEKYELVVERLLAFQADATRSAASGCSVLHIAARAGASEKVIRLLVEAGARPDARNAGGHVPFFVALASGRKVAARALVEHIGPVGEPLGREAQSLTPLAAASLLGDAMLVESILQRLRTRTGAPVQEPLAAPLAAVRCLQRDSPDELVRLTGAGLGDCFWRLVREPRLPPEEAAAALRVGDRVVLTGAYATLGHAAKGPLRPGDVGQIVKIDKGTVPLQVKVGEKSFWYREGALRRYRSVPARVLQWRGQFRHPYIASGKMVDLRIDLDGEAGETRGRWHMSDEGPPKLRGADVRVERSGDSVTLHVDSGDMRLLGSQDEFGNMHGEVLHLNHRAGRFFLFPASDDATVRCPRGHATTRMHGLMRRNCTCDVCSKSIERDEPLYFTCVGCNYDVCSDCCGVPLPARLPPESGVHLASWTPLHFAVAAGHAEAARSLIAARADALARDDDGRTPLHWASAGPVSPLVEVLLAQPGGAAAAAVEDVSGLTALRLAPPELLRFAGEDAALLHGDAIEVGRSARAGEAAATGVYRVEGQRHGRPLYRRNEGPGWAVCWDHQTSRWGLYREKYEASCMQYENRTNASKCPVDGWTSIVAPDPVPSFEEVLPWRAGAALLAATHESMRPKPADLKSSAARLPPLAAAGRGGSGAEGPGPVLTRRTASGQLQVMLPPLPDGSVPPDEFFEQLVAEMIRRGDLPSEPPPGCVQQ